VKAGAPDPAHTVAEGKGLEEATPGEPAPVHVKTFDDQGNPVPVGGAKVGAALRPTDAKGDEAPVVADVKDNGDGTYDLSYVPEKSGPHDLDVALDNKPIAKSPFKVDVGAGPASAKESDVELEHPKHPAKGDDKSGDEDNKGKEKEPSGDGNAPHSEKLKPNDPLFKIRTKDKSGTPKKKGGDPVKVVLSKRVHRPANVVDNGDGSYSVKLPHGLEGGNYKVRVDVGGEHIDAEKLPKNLDVEEEEDDKVLSDEADKKALTEALPKSGARLLPFLKTLTPDERREFIKELSKGK